MNYRILLLWVCISASVSAQQVNYEVRFPNIRHHEAEVTAVFSDISSPVLDIRMSRSSPGRYALHEFIKNVYSVRAEDGRGKKLDVTQNDPYGWQVSAHDGTVRFFYTVYGDHVDGTYLSLDASHAHINPPAMFVYAQNADHRNIRLRFTLPDKTWRIATQLKESGASVYIASDLAYLMDSPIEISAFQESSWRVPATSGDILFSLILHHTGTPKQTEYLTKVGDAIVREARAVFGEFPAFDQGRYAFMMELTPYASWDGMEHRNSCVITNRDSISGDFLDIASTMAHEFFHAWNVERLRPKSLEPFDKMRVNMSEELWFAEGFTSYYDDLIITRAGIQSVDRYCKVLTKLMNNVVVDPSKNFGGPAHMSQRAAFTDAATSVDAQNRKNIFSTYYWYGATVALGLDLTLRTEHGKTLDDYMQLLWKAYGKTEKPYTSADLESALGDLIGDKKRAQRFFDETIRGNRLPDYKKLLDYAGFVTRAAHADRPTLGQVRLAADDDGILIKDATLIGDPLYLAGLDRGDKIFSLNDQAVRSIEAWEEVLKQLKPDDSVTIVYEQRGLKGTSRVKVAVDPSLEIIPVEQTGKSLTEKKSNFRAAWLSSKSIDKPLLYRYCKKCRRAYEFQYEFCPFDGVLLQITPEE